MELAGDNLWAVAWFYGHDYMHKEMHRAILKSIGVDVGAVIDNIIRGDRLYNSTLIEDTAELRPIWNRDAQLPPVELKTISAIRELASDNLQSVAKFYGYDPEDNEIHRVIFNAVGVDNCKVIDERIRRDKEYNSTITGDTKELRPIWNRDGQPPPVELKTISVVRELAGDDISRCLLHYGIDSSLNHRLGIHVLFSEIGNETTFIEQ
ncbi:hypothetical protein CANTEDRAFT_95548 [Yamadazyma tenuis ATCC 10573]|uniref:Uncharacterized protein n=2 Tax=Candida tenuis TaxID=2315449 RepID=G3BBU5_CANTC|nr:uncharacterized protein CANTEDRAFT_95548 [Yamadazyma tenuis ATCC 10573]EGV60081.1 hypothetical protein CANTEDRAFT_95548 [Yamadazyma tenuis ATCC 10573]